MHLLCPGRLSSVQAPLAHVTRCLRDASAMAGKRSYRARTPQAAELVDGYPILGPLYRPSGPPVRSFRPMRSAYAASLGHDQVQARADVAAEDADPRPNDTPPRHRPNRNPRSRPERENVRIQWNGRIPWRAQHKHFDVSRFETPQNSMSVMSYNVLAESLVAENMWLYGKVPPEWLEWTARRTRLIHEISRHSCDLVCLQEVDKYEEFERQLVGHGYVGTYLKRTGDHQDGVAIFHKATKLLLLESEAVRFKLTDEPKSPMNRDNVCLIHVYRHLGSGRTFVAATAHLLFNQKRGDVKLNQLCMAFARIADAAERHGKAPVVFAGDFNLLPGSALYRFAVGGAVDFARTDYRLASGQMYPIQDARRRNYVNERRPLLVAPEVSPVLKEGRVWVDGDALRHGLKLRSVHPYVPGVPPMITQWTHAGFKGTVDYILYSPGFVCSKYLWPLTIEQLRQLGGLPNESLASDHQSLVATLCFAGDAPAAEAESST